MHWMPVNYQTVLEAVPFVRYFLNSVIVSVGSTILVVATSLIFILPGFEFRITDALITNFHMPRSTLLLLVSAFAGYDPLMKMYTEALDRGYRFLSYGDATLLLNRETCPEKKHSRNI